jgi:hypothetical protein
MTLICMYVQPSPKGTVAFAIHVCICTIKIFPKKLWKVTSKCISYQERVDSDFPRGEGLYTPLLLHEQGQSVDTISLSL